MTTNTTVLQAPRRPLVRPAIWILAAALLAAGLGASATLMALTKAREDPAVAKYEEQAKPIITNHNELAARWNEFVPRFNAVLDDSPEMTVLYQEGLDLAKKLTRDSQNVLSQWRKLAPPEKATESHALALSALELTQDGYIAYEDYFYAAVTFDSRDATMAQLGSDKLSEAAALWAQAQEAAANR